jgi:hypothetical protein
MYVKGAISLVDAGRGGCLLLKKWRLILIGKKKYGSCFCVFQEQLALLHELHEERYFDVFEFNAGSLQWACFMCNHPEKVSSLLQDGLPEIAVSYYCTSSSLSLPLPSIHHHHCRHHHHCLKDIVLC